MSAASVPLRRPSPATSCILTRDLPTRSVQGLVIECIKCTIKGEFAVSAYQGDTLDFGDKEQLSKSFKDSDIIQSSGFDFTDAWVGVAIPKFEAHIEFSVKSDGSVPSGDDLVMRMLDNPIQIPVGRVRSLRDKCWCLADKVHI